MPLGERRRGGPYLFDLGGIVSGEVQLVSVSLPMDVERRKSVDKRSPAYSALRIYATEICF
jgi:hypothetical protein